MASPYVQIKDLRIFGFRISKSRDIAPCTAPSMYFCTVFDTENNVFGLLMFDRKPDGSGPVRHASIWSNPKLFYVLFKELKKKSNRYLFPYKSDHSAFFL